MLNTLSHIKYTHKDDYLISGLLTKIINNSSTSHILQRSHKLLFKIDKITKELLLLISDQDYEYAVVEECLKGYTKINLH